MEHRARIIHALLGSFAVVAAALIFVAPAAARTCTKRLAPPGHAGATQYVELVPTSCGSTTPPSGGAGGTSGSSIAGLGQGGTGVHRLSRLGTNGKSAAALAAATAPPTGSSRSRLANFPAPSGSAAGALSSALGGLGGGLGFVLAVLMGLALLAAIAAGVFRGRRPSGPSA